MINSSHDRINSIALMYGSNIASLTWKVIYLKGESGLRDRKKMISYQFHHRTTRCIYDPLTY